MRSTFIMAPVLALSLGLSAWAQAQKIAVIDMQGSLLATKDGQQAAAELKSKFGPKEAEFNKRQQDLAAKQDQLRKGQNTMSDEAKASADREIAATVKALQRDADDTKADFQAEENRLLGGILSKMQAILTKYATDHQISMIVDVSQQPNNLLYADQSVNISAAVIALYDQAAGAPAASAATPASPPKAPAPAPQKPATPGTTPGGK